MPKMATESAPVPALRRGIEQHLQHREQHLTVQMHARAGARSSTKSSPPPTAEQRSPKRAWMTCHRPPARARPVRRSRNLRASAIHELTRGARGR